MRFIKFLFAALAVFASFQSNAQAYVPDPGFAGSGAFSEATVTGFAYNSAALQSDGKIVLARVGAIIRLNSDGTLDNTFADHGRYQVDLWFDKVLNQPDGKILACGHVRRGSGWHSILTRLLPDGTPDPLFGTAGLTEIVVDTAIDAFTCMALAPDGSIYAGGNYALRYTMLVKCKADGQLDTSFGAGGIARDTISEFTDIKIDDAGRLVISGCYSTGLSPEQGVLVRYMPYGAHDPLFGNLGVVMSGKYEAWFYSALTILPGGDIICVGPYGPISTGCDYVTCRYHADGNIDSSFGVRGMAVSDIMGHDDYASGMVITGDKIVVCGNTLHHERGRFPSAIRLNMDGGLDTTFGNKGVMADTNGAQGAHKGALFQPDGKLLFYGNNGERVFVPIVLNPIVFRFYDPSLSIKDQAKHNPINIFPNPTSGELCITGIKKPHVIITSLAGRKLMDVNASTVNICHLADGIYIISILDTNNKLLKTEKLVKGAEY